MADGLGDVPAAPPPEAVANNLGAARASEGELEAAIEHFKLAVERNPDYLPGHKNLLAAYVETERWSEARRAAETVEALHPFGEQLRRGRVPEDEEAAGALREDRSFLANLGRAYLETGALGRAKTRYTLCLRLFPLQVEGYNGLAEVARRRGEYGEAVRLYAQSLKHYAKQPEVLRRLQSMKGESAELTAKIEWVVATYARPGGGREGPQSASFPEAPTGPQGPRAPGPPLPGRDGRIPAPQPPDPWEGIDVR
ncbi:MAG: tetratricopeptide repeat protein [Longimicrobiales bacterium]